MKVKNIVICFMVIFLISLTETSVYAVSYDNPENAPEIKASLLMEAESGQVLQHENGYEKVPVGTLNKMMTLLLTAEAVENGVIDEDTMITASAYANSMTQATIWLLAGEKMSAGDLIKSVAVGNANDASVALAEAVYGSETEFVKHMNTRAFELGMHDTVYTDCTGYDNDIQHSTAYDTALLAREMIKHKILTDYMTIWHDYVRDGSTELVNENNLVRTCKGLLGIKAGHSRMSGNCAAIAVRRDNSSYISVVLGYSDKNERFSDAEKLINTGFSQYQTTVPMLSSEYLLPVKVKGGADSAVELKIGNISALAVPSGRTDDISCVMIIPKYINAPVARNQKIGCAVFYLDDTMLCRTDIMTAQPVESMTAWTAFKRIYTSLLK